MKTVSVPALAALWITGSAGAFDVPNSAHRAHEVPQAIAEATRSKRGIVFVVSDSSLKPS
jgi:hypothetical protein